MHVNNASIESDQTYIAEFMEKMKSVDYQGHLLTYISFGWEQLKDAYNAIKSSKLLDAFFKIFPLIEAIPYLNLYTGGTRVAFATCYAFWSLSKTFTTRLYDKGIIDSIKALLTQDIPFILKHLIRGAGVYQLSSYESPVAKVITGIATYSYDFITNNLDIFKKSNYIPNFIHKQKN